MEDLIPLVLVGLVVVLAVIEAVRPARKLPAVKRWRLKNALCFVIYFGLSATLPLLWDGWLGEHRLIDASGLGMVGGAIVGFLVLELVSYAWHRLMHNVPFLWRFFHQMHHSAERVDVPGAFYFHPLDMAGFILVGSVSLVLLVGVSAEAALIANVAAFFCAVFQHMNLRTPRWLGYIIQRPENHALHHERGVHAYNYGDISIWDIVFGTFRNPTDFPAEAGFYDGASARVGAMLIGRDISADAPVKADSELPRLKQAA